LGLCEVVTVAVERQLGHGGGGISAIGFGDELGLASFMRPPALCFDEDRGHFENGHAAASAPCFAGA
jgi:hypothetical protein